MKVRFTEDEIILIQQLSDGELVDAYIINRYDLSVTKSDGYWSGQCELKETKIQSSKSITLAGHTEIRSVIWHTLHDFSLTVCWVKQSS